MPVWAIRQKASGLWRSKAAVRDCGQPLSKEREEREIPEAKRQSGDFSSALNFLCQDLDQQMKFVS